MAEEELIRIQWHVDRSREPCEYMLMCQDPSHADLVVSVSSEEMSERVARARLIEKMYQLGKEKGIPPSRLRFKVNGIDE